MPFTLLPSIHVGDGRVMHLLRGEVVPEPRRTDPMETAAAFKEQGAQWLHLLPLTSWGLSFDLRLIDRIAEHTGLNIQVAAGHTVTDDHSLARMLATRCARLNLGTVTFDDPTWCAKAIAEHGERIGVTLPVWITAEGPRVARHGRMADGGCLWEALERFDRMGCTRYAVTDVGREGTLTGPNLHLLREVSARTDAHVLAAGGIATLDDLAAVTALAPAGVAGALVGRALFTDAFTLTDALTVAHRPEQHA
ncbi:HisA/HisF-related TIM barrel protein [Kitasatospora sp. NPDC036755]|uniref:HisA/HisF-related TIM barrel protein n=1 Tax=Kitasatospora sp. NPDC036755 TaxID=3154600 RepID=UPI0033F6BB78